MPILGSDFIEGLDITGQSLVSASQILQMIRAAQPNTDRGLVLNSGDYPDVATYPSLKRYLHTNPSEDNRIIRTWSPLGNAWEPIQQADASVTTDIIADNAVTFEKLVAPGVGNALKLMRANAAGDGYEFWALVFAANSIAITALAKGTGNANKLVRIASNDSGFEFFTLNAADYLAADSIALAKINMTQNLSLIINDATAVTTEVTIAALMETYVAAKGIPIAKLAIGSEGQILRTVSGATVWAAETARGVVSSVLATDLQVLPAGLVNLEWTHGQANLNFAYFVSLVCIDADLSYAAGEEVPITTVAHHAGGGSDTQFPVSVSVNATKVFARFSATPIWILSKAADTWAAIDRTKWKVRCRLLS